MKEPLSTSTQNPKIELPNKELVGVKTTKQKEQDLKSESARLPKPTMINLLGLLPLANKRGRTLGHPIIHNKVIHYVL